MLKHWLLDSTLIVSGSVVLRWSSVIWISNQFPYDADTTCPGDHRLRTASLEFPFLDPDAGLCYKPTVRSFWNPWAQGGAENSHMPKGSLLFYRDLCRVSATLWLKSMVFPHHDLGVRSQLLQSHVGLWRHRRASHILASDLKSSNLRREQSPSWAPEIERHICEGLSDIWMAGFAFAVVITPDLTVMNDAGFRSNSSKACRVKTRVPEPSVLRPFLSRLLSDRETFEKLTLRQQGSEEEGQRHQGGRGSFHI